MQGSASGLDVQRYKIVHAGLVWIFILLLRTCCYLWRCSPVFYFRNMPVNVFGRWVIETRDRGTVDDTPIHTSLVRKRGRPRIWWPQPAVKEDDEAAEELLMAWGPDESTSERIRRDFRLFGEINSLDPLAALKPWIGQMLRSGLGYSTADTYVGYVRTLFPRYCPIYGRWKKALALAHADQDTRQHVDLNTREVRLLLDRIRDPCLSALIFILASCGCRCRDAARLRRKQILLTADGFLRIEFRILKQRRKREHKYIFKAPLNWFGPPSATARRYLELGHPEQRLFGAFFLAAACNTALAPFYDGEQKLPTTKTFRRYFINELLSWGDGDLHLVSKYTGHFRPGTIDAFYRRSDV